MKPVNKYIDHTLLKSTATKQDIITLCQEALKYDFFSVCVNGSYAKLAAMELQDSNVKVCCVVGFPLGTMSSNAKAFEANQAIEDGANEIDMVMNLGAFKSGDFDKVKRDIRAVKEAVGCITLKVILETCELDEAEIVKACEICLDASADFVKTSTGFGSGGATESAVKLMKQTVGNRAKIKASGGIRDLETAQAYIGLGVDRLGVSSGVAIMEGLKSNSDY